MKNKRNTLFTLIAACSLLLLSSCKKDVVPTLSVNPESIECAAEGKDLSLYVTTNTDWTAASDQAWCAVYPQSGTGDATLKVSIAENATFTSREATVTVKTATLTKTVKVTEKGVVASISASPEAMDFDPLGGSLAIKVTSNTSWTASLASDWCSIDKASGDGDATVTLTVKENLKFNPRTATVTFTETTSNTSVSLSVGQTGAEPGRYIDSLALLAVYKAAGIAETEGEYEVIPNPTTKQTTIFYNSAKPIDTWTGVTLSENRVTRIVWAMKSVTADWMIPSEIGMLTALHKLQMGTESLSGALPEELYDCVKLDTLALGANPGITGTISSKIGQLTELSYLFCDRNTGMTGTLPAELGKCTKIASLNLSNSGFTGSIPTEWSGMVSMKNFMFYSNSLTGTVPEIFASMTDLVILQLHKSPGLTGSLPKSIASCSAFKSLQASECNFDGNIPEEYGNLPATTSMMWVHSNKLKGVVPAAVQAHANWTKWKPATNILPQQEGYGLTTE